jgi:ribose transport system substrate-binding protein
VEQGILAATFEYPTGGGEAIARALELLNGGTVPKEITLPSKVYTPVNIADGGETLGQD